MASTVINIPSSGNNPRQPLLQPAAAAAPRAQTAAAPRAQTAAAPRAQTAAAPRGQNAAFQNALRTTASLANFLPTGTVIVFEIFSPFTTNGGVCYPSNLYATTVLIALCSLSGFVLSFSDSFTDETGDVRYGFATWTGLAVLEGPPLPSEIAAPYRMGLRDLVHGFSSLMIFAGVALLDRNVVNCFFPTPTPQLERVLTGLPLAIALICSVLYLIFPNDRSGIGFPVRRI